ncbi:MAG: DUF6527 family protein [Gammaproteobacteria bacterium]|nr:DUF6527 family protein [Gammaproteobacteria bacterium]
MIRWLFNLWAAHHQYRTEWVEDLPDGLSKDTVYIVGGRKYPFQAAVVCPRRACKQVIHLDLSPGVEQQWHIEEHGDGEISLHPSIHVTGLSCNCHYWLRHGTVRWSETPKLRVPRENRHDP